MAEHEKGSQGPLRRLNCPHCHTTVGLRSGTHSSRFRCPECNHVLELAVRSKGVSPRSHAPKAPKPASIGFCCEVCGTLLSAAVDQVGETLECPDCGTHAQVPPLPAVKIKPRLEVPADLYGFQDEQSDSVVDESSEYFFICRTCDALIYVRDEQAGSTISCRDCNVKLVVPSRPLPPKKWKPRDVATVPITAASVAPNEDQIRGAKQLLQEAEQKVDEERAKRPKPPKQPFRTGVLNFPFYPLMIGLWAAMAAGQGIVLYLFDLAIETSQSKGADAILAIFIGIPAMFIAIALAAFAATHMLNIVERTADGQDQIANSPDTTFFGYVVSIATLFVPASMSGLPGIIIGWLTGMLLGTIIPPIHYVTWIPAFLCHFFLFPVFLLSVLVNDSLGGLYSETVWKSLRDAPKAWRGFYRFSLPVMALWFACQAGVLLFSSWLLRIPLLAIAWILLLSYYRLLGRLAWVLEHQWEKWASQRILEEEEEEE